MKGPFQGGGGATRWHRLLQKSNMFGIRRLLCNHEVKSHCERLFQHISRVQSCWSLYLPETIIKVRLALLLRLEENPFQQPFINQRRCSRQYFTTSIYCVDNIVGMCIRCFCISVLSKICHFFIRTTETFESFSLITLHPFLSLSLYFPELS